MDLGGAPKHSGKRTLPPLERNDDPKRPKRAGAAVPKQSAASAPFDLAKVLVGANDAARLRQQYVNSALNQFDVHVCARAGR